MMSLDPKIQWKHRGFDVDTESPTSNIRVASFAGAETTLTIKGFSRSNAGQYQCVATNEHGEAIQNVHIEVASKSFIFHTLYKIVNIYYKHTWF